MVTRGVAKELSDEKKISDAQSVGWLSLMSSRAELTPALSCQQCDSWQVPGHMLSRPSLSVVRNMTIVSGPNQNWARGRIGLSRYIMYGAPLVWSPAWYRLAFGVIFTVPQPAGSLP